MDCIGYTLRVFVREPASARLLACVLRSRSIRPTQEEKHGTSGLPGRLDDGGARALRRASPAPTRATARRAPGGKPLLLELRRYRLRNGPLQTRFSAYAKEALVPALGRAGIAPVGAFTVSFGSDSPTLHLLLPHKDAESLLTLESRLGADADYAQGRGVAPRAAALGSSVRALRLVADWRRAHAARYREARGRGGRRVARLRATDLPEPERARPQEDRDVRGRRRARIFRRLGMPRRVLRPRPGRSGSAEPQLHARVRGHGRAREGVGRVPRRLRLAEAARSAGVRRHRLGDRRHVLRATDYSQI